MDCRIPTHTCTGRFMRCPPKIGPGKMTESRKEILMNGKRHSPEEIITILHHSARGGNERPTAGGILPGA